jgi:hypothetical protein
MKNYKIIFSLILIFSFFSCKKTVESAVNPSCFDAGLKEQYKNAFCTQDCPGIIGCDDKMYCNECEAARFGIRKK